MGTVRPTVLANPIALSKASRYIPLWRRQMEYPVFQPGDPQVRLYMPNYWMKLVRPRFPLPPGVLKFEVQPQMSAGEVRQMIEKLYNTRVLHTTVHKLEGTPERDTYHPSRYPIVGHGTKPSPLDLYRKVAYVFLADREAFQFPDLFADARPSGSSELKKFEARSTEGALHRPQQTGAHRERAYQEDTIREIERATRQDMDDKGDGA